MGKQAVSCLNISFAESNIVPYVSKFLSSESKSLHKTSIKYLLFFLRSCNDIDMDNKARNGRVGKECRAQNCGGNN